MERKDVLVRLEVVCGILWLLSDGAWLMEWRLGNLTAGLLAIVCAISIFFYQERTRVPILVCCADTSWLVMNVLWATGDLADPKNGLLIFSAKIFFFLAIAFTLSAFWNCRARQDVFQLILRRVRLLRIPHSN